MAKTTGLTSGEQEIMKAIGTISEEGGLVTTAAIRKKLFEWRGEKVYSQAIYAQVTHLEEKGFARMERREGSSRVTIVPLADKEEYVRKQAAYWVDYWNKSGAGYAMAALSGGGSLTKEEKEELRRYLDELD